MPTEVHLDKSNLASNYVLAAVVYRVCCFNSVVPVIIVIFQAAVACFSLCHGLNKGYCYGFVHSTPLPTHTQSLSLLFSTTTMLFVSYFIEGTPIETDKRGSFMSTHQLVDRQYFSFQFIIFYHLRSRDRDPRTGYRFLTVAPFTVNVSAEGGGRGGGKVTTMCL